MSVLTLAAWRADPGLGAIWLISYGIGLGVPMVAVGQGMQRLQHAWPGKMRVFLQRFFGGLLLDVGLYVVWTA